MKPLSKNTTWPYRHVLILLVIILGGAFLRTYRLHDWLEFRGDQTRDATIVDTVVNEGSKWPLLGPNMNHTGDTEETRFHLGPIYYDFQIMSAKIFGSNPDVLAYPDVMFCILSIPLLYAVLRILFGANLSLGLTGLYMISPYIVHYSRYAWSSNSVPFLVLLFLYSLYKFQNDDEKTDWVWIIGLGFAWGVGFQIHAILMVLFSTVSLFAFISSMQKNPAVWRRWAVIGTLFLILNMGQIAYEMKTNFGNTRIFINYFYRDKSTEIPVSKLTLLENDLSCHFAANFFFLTSAGEGKCLYDYSEIFSRDQKIGFGRMFKAESGRFVLIISLLFSVIGYSLLICRAKNEAVDEKRRFLRLMVLYAGLGFVIMAPLSNDVFSDLRYFTFVIFMPYLFLGFIVNGLSEWSAKWYSVVVVGIVFILIAWFDIFGIIEEASVLNDGNGICTRTAILGELEPIADYVSSHADGRTSVYLDGDYMMINYIIFPMKFLLAERHIDAIKSGEESSVTASSDTPTFYVSCKVSPQHINETQKIGRAYVYPIENR